MTIEEIKAKQSELMIKHAKLGCEILGKGVCDEISQWRDAGIELSQNISDRSQQQLLSVINADMILKNLSSMDTSILEGAVDLDKVRQNADKMKSNIESDLNNWELVLHALFALSCIDENEPAQKPDPQPKPADESINTDKSDSPKGDFIDPELAKVILDSIDNIVDNMSKGNEMPPGWEWLDVYHINPKLQRNRYIVNNETEEVVDTVTGYPVESKVFKDGEKLLFKTIDRNVVYVRKSLIFSPKETEAKPSKPACSLVSSRMLDWNSLIDKNRYRIYADGRIEDTKTNTFLKPIDECAVALETINRGKGMWLIHELVWAAFHPEDLPNIRRTGNVYRINGRVDDNRLSNLIFKANVVPSTMVINKMNAPTETKTDGDDTLKEAPKETKQSIEEKKPKVEYKCIDWIPGIDSSRYSIMRDGTVVDNRYSGKPLVPKMLNGKRVVKLIGKQNKTATYTIADLLNHAFPDQPHAIRSSGKFRIEDVTIPLDRSKVAAEATKATPESERKIPVDWIDGIPSTKYLVSEEGYVFNTISGKRIVPNASGTINMSDSIDKGSRKLRIHMKMESLIWKAFHAEDRQLEKVYLEHIDGDSANCAIKNLRKKIVDRKR